MITDVGAATISRLLRELALVGAVASTLLVPAPPSTASPPPAGSKAAEKLIPYAEAIKGLTQPGSTRGCCDLSDCRVVVVRIARNGGYEAFISLHPQTRFVPRVRFWQMLR